MTRRTGSTVRAMISPRSLSVLPTHTLLLFSSLGLISLCSAGFASTDENVLGRASLFSRTLSKRLSASAQVLDGENTLEGSPSATAVASGSSRYRTSYSDGGNDVSSQGSLSHVAQAKLTRHWWASPHRLTLVLIEAEEEYNANLRKRRGVLGGGNPPWARDAPPPGAPPGPSPFTFMDRWFIPLYPCPKESRLGAWGDGGKWICMSHYGSQTSQPVVLSVGSNGDTTFEAAVFRTLGVPTYTLDFSLSPEARSQVESLEFVKFYPVGLTGSGQKRAYRRKFRKRAKFLTIPEVLKLIEQPYVDIFKVDCELCEYELVKDFKRLYTRDQVPFGQLQIEIHRCADISMTQELLETLEDLGFRMFHSEINVYGASFNNWQYEVSFIHESLVQPRLGL